jgi:CDP-paratose 2-epimerase
LKAIVTGSGGLVGSACVRFFAEHGWQVIGLDNNMRREFFGHQGSTSHEVVNLRQTVPGYRHYSFDIRDRQKVRDLLHSERPAIIIHTAAQPSHDKASSIPYDDFDINAVGTLNLLVAARDFCPESPFCFTSTNKVYGDRPNTIPLRELDMRFDYADGRDGIDESMSIDSSLHSLFGVSKASADLLCQEFGRYYNMPTGIFRCGCLTGPHHAAVELHGYLAYIVLCAVHGKPYSIYGYRGKQVRDQIHCSDVASLFLEFYESPRPGEVFNLGGGRANSISIMETVATLGDMGFQLEYNLLEQNRTGDHICYISDISKIRACYPRWQMQYDLPRILSEMVSRYYAAETISVPKGRLRGRRHSGSDTLIRPVSETL